MAIAGQNSVRTQCAIGHNLGLREGERFWHSQALCFQSLGNQFGIYINERLDVEEVWHGGSSMELF